MAVVCGLPSPAGASSGTGLALQEYANDGAGGHVWNAYNQTQNADGPGIVGRPSPITYGASVQVFVQSASGDLMSWVNDNQGGRVWNAYDLSTVAGGGGPISGDPDAVAQGSTVDVFVESGAEHLVEYTNDGVGGRLWNVYDLSTLASGRGPIEGSPSGFFEGTTPYVFVRSSNGDLVEYAGNGSGAHPWNATDLSAVATGGGQIQGDPSALDQSGTANVFTRSTTGSLVHYVQSGSGWSAANLSATANGGSTVEADPTSVVYGASIHLYVTSSVGDLTEYADDSAGGRPWNAYDLSALAGGGGKVSGDATTILYGITVHVYIQSASSHLTEYVNDGAGGHLWNAYDLSDDAGDGAPVGTAPGAVLYGGTSVHVYAGGSATCASNVANQLDSTGSATQLITVDSPAYSSTTATLTAWQLEGGCWQAVFGPWTARVGTTGVSDNKKEGDGATPTGAFSIGATMYGTNPNPGVTYAYHQLSCGDWWDEDPASADYNTFQHVSCGTTPPFGGDSEALWQIFPAYEYFAVIDYNVAPAVPGAGSAIFLHVDTGSATAGCVSIPVADLTAVLDWLSPTANPLIVIGTDAEIRSF